MKQIVLLWFLLLGVLVFETNNASVLADTNDKPSPYEEIYPEIGYKTVEEAVKDFEQHLKKDLKLPLRVPPVSFTHVFGRFNDMDDSFEVEYVSDQSPENHYIIDVRTVGNKIPKRVEEKYLIKTLKLENGKNANLIRISGFNVLVFERDKWQYMLSVDKRISDKVTPESLVQIANSIDYPIKHNSKLK